MVRIRHLQHAPITEAILDLRVVLPDQFDPDVFLQLREKLQSQYPHVENRELFEGTVEFKAGRPVTRTKVGRQGFLFKSQDGCSIVQFRVDGFTFNRLKPYTSWEQIRPEAECLWKRYSSLADAGTIKRLAVRYVNRLVLPIPSGGLEAYLTAPPIVPDGIPNNVAHFLNRLVVVEPDTGITTNITQILERGENSHSLPIILDIDVYKTVELPANNQGVWMQFEQLREMKNQVFFNSITDDTVRMYE